MSSMALRTPGCSGRSLWSKSSSKSTSIFAGGSSISIFQRSEKVKTKTKSECSWFRRITFPSNQSFDGLLSLAFCILLRVFSSLLFSTSGCFLGPGAPTFAPWLFLFDSLSTSFPSLRVCLFFFSSLSFLRYSSKNSTFNFIIRRYFVPQKTKNNNNRIVHGYQIDTKPTAAAVVCPFCSLAVKGRERENDRSN